MAPNSVRSSGGVVWDEATIISVLNNPEGATGRHQNRYLIWRMLQALYKRQTESEKQTESTRLKNYVGFNAADARVLSSIAAQSQRYRNLSPRQARLVAGRLRKYISQLLDIVAEHRQPEFATVDLDADAKRFGCTSSEWFDATNAMDIGEYQDFVARLEAERASG